MENLNIANPNLTPQVIRPVQTQNSNHTVISISERRRQQQKIERYIKNQSKIVQDFCTIACFTLLSMLSISTSVLAFKAGNLQGSYA